MLNEVEVRAKVKEIIHNVTSIPVEDIGDNASFRNELDLDSLSLLEIAVDVDYAFKLGLPEEDLQQLQTVQESVDLVLQHKGAGSESVTA